MNRFSASTLFILLATLFIIGTVSALAATPTVDGNDEEEKLYLPLLVRVPQPLPNEIFIPAGSFQMGCDPKVDKCLPNEQPLHRVTLSAYYIDKYEVTNARYKACDRAGACPPPTVNESATRYDYYDNPLYADYPVLAVGSGDAEIFCAWEGKRLLTEAEWERAARGADDTRKFPWGDIQPKCSLLNSDYCLDDTTRVGSYPSGASPDGVLDMAGNVAEWTNDWYAPDYYQVSPPNDPQGPESGSNVVVRGSTWKDTDDEVRLAKRQWEPANWSFPDIGFRCGRSW
jgi:formylglycine-generating enzyme required for sulfatase activity